jgi:DNA-binding CsgD family transcriptional regulator
MVLDAGALSLADLFDIFDGYARGLALLDNRGRLVRSNETFARHLGMDFEAGGESLRLHRSHCPATKQAFERMIQRACSGELQLPVCLTIAVERHAPLILELRRIVLRIGARRRQAHLLLSLVELGTPILLTPEILRAAFGLTQAEVRLAQQLMSGRSLREAATLQAIGLPTVRTQLASIFLKTQTSRQGQLIAKLTGFAQTTGDHISANGQPWPPAIVTARVGAEEPGAGSATRPHRARL